MGIKHMVKILGREEVVEQYLILALPPNHRPTPYPTPDPYRNPPTLTLLLTLPAFT